MAIHQEAPFKRGETFFNGETIPSSVPTGEFMGGWNLEGSEYRWTDGVGLPNGGYGTGLEIVTRVVRNSASHNILPGQLCVFGATRYGDSAPTLLGTNVGEISQATADYAFPADEFLPPGGVPPGDLFYIVVKGPCLVKTAASGTVALNVGQKVVASTSTATTDGNAGAVVAQSVSGATGPLANQIQNAVGRAMSATTSGNTATPVLIAVGW